MSTGPSVSAPSQGFPRRSSFADLAELRGTAYELLGGLFCYPARADLAELAAEARDFPPKECFAREFSFLPPMRTLLDRLCSLEESGLDELEREYVGLLLVNTSKALCPPYESVYIESRGRERGLVSVAVERAYAASGVALVDRGELPDHAALELGFLSVLCGEEEQAWREGDVERALECLRREEEFHERHLQRWFSIFARRLARAAAPGSLYRLLAEAARAFVVHDRDLVRALLAEPPP
jgi:TorA maturation chaperone TorD